MRRAWVVLVVSLVGCGAYDRFSILASGYKKGGNCDAGASESLCASATAVAFCESGAWVEYAAASCSTKDGLSNVDFSGQVGQVCPRSLASVGVAQCSGPDAKLMCFGPSGSSAATWSAVACANCRETASAVVCN